MLAQRLFSPQTVETQPLRMVELPDPLPGHGQVRLRVAVCGVCHTDLHIVEGEIHPPTLPLTPGHQAVGVVDAVGEGVERVQIGERVGVPWLHRACGVCEFCRRGEENLCPNAFFTGFHVNGGYAAAMLADERYVLPVPPRISSEQAAPLLCAGIIGYRSLRKADLQPGERLGLVGFGASAHLAIQIALHWGCEVFVFSRSEGHRQHAMDLGARWAGRLGDTPPDLLDRMVIFAPVGALVPPSLQVLRPGGTLAINAIHMSPIPSFPYESIYGERTLRSVANATYQDGLDLLELADRIPLRSTVQLYPLDAANQALQDLKASRFNGEAVLVVGDG